MSRRRLYPLSMLAALALVFSACGDDDDSAADADETTTTADPGGDTEETTTTDGGDDGDDVAAGDLGECGFFAEFATDFEDLDPAELFAPGGSTDFGGFFGPLAEEFQDVADAAPEEIQSDFRTVADTFSEVAAQLEGVEIDLNNPEAIDPEAMEALEAMDTQFTGEFEESANAIDAWVQENCSELSGTVDLDSFGN